MKKFKCHKVVLAGLIASLVTHESSMTYEVITEDGDKVKVNEELATRIHSGGYADGKGYLVGYFNTPEALAANKPDYYSVSPKKVLEDGYSLIKEKPNYHADDTMRQGSPSLPQADIDAMMAIKEKGQELLDLLKTTSGNTREMGIARMKLEESVMWAVKGVTA